MSEGKTFKFKSLKLGNKDVVSTQFSFNFDQDWIDNAYFTIDKNTCRMNYTGSWSGVLGDKGVKDGVKHYKIKITKSLEKHQLIGYVAAEEKHPGKAWNEFVSKSLLFSHDGTTRAGGNTKFMKK